MYSFFDSYLDNLSVLFLLEILRSVYLSSVEFLIKNLPFCSQSILEALFEFLLFFLDFLWNLALSLDYNFSLLTGVISFSGESDCSCI